MRFCRSLSLRVSAGENESTTCGSNTLSPVTGLSLRAIEESVAPHKPVIASDRRERGNLVPALHFKSSDCVVTAFLATTPTPVIASDRRERGNLVPALHLFYEIASSLCSSQRHTPWSRALHKPLIVSSLKQENLPEKPYYSKLSN